MTPQQMMMLLSSAGEYDPALLGGLIADIDLRNAVVSEGLVSSVPEGSGNTLTASGSVAYTSSNPALNNKPSATGPGILTRASWVGGNVPQSVTLYLVGTWTSVAAGAAVACDGGGVANRHLLRNNTVAEFFAGSAISGASAPASGTPFIWRAVSGATDSFTLWPKNAAAITASGDAGAGGCDGATLLSNFSNSSPWTGGSITRAIWFAGNKSAVDAELVQSLLSIYGVTAPL